MTTSLNQAKSADGPEDWLPPFARARSRYVVEWTGIKHRWALAVDTRERGALTRLADKCPNVTVRVRTY